MLSQYASELLLHAANQGDLEQCQALALEAKANLQYRNSLGETCLHVAAIRGRVAVTELLLALGADPNVATYRPYGARTPLHFAVRTDNVKLVEALIERNADANIPDAFGKTALHDAALTGNKLMVELLLRSGASAEVEDMLGKKAKDYAFDKCFTSIVALLSPPLPEGETMTPPLSFAQKMELEDKRIVWRKTKA